MNTNSDEDKKDAQRLLSGFKKKHNLSQYKKLTRAFYYLHTE